MPENEARAWWADVQHVRESIERRRGGVAESPAPADVEPARRFARAGGAEPPLPRLDDLDWPPELPAREGRRFEHPTPAEPADSVAATDETRPARRRASAAAEADRAASRGRRPRPEADRPRARSHRADDAGMASPGEPAARPATEVRTVTPGRPPATSGGTDYDLAAGLGLTPAPPAPAPPARRTVQITGRTVAAPAVPRLVEVERRRPGRRPAERVGPRPDRIALYAVLLGFFLILVAATSSRASTSAAQSADAAALHAPAR